MARGLLCSAAPRALGLRRAVAPGARLPGRGSCARQACVLGTLSLHCPHPGPRGEGRLPQASRALCTLGTLREGEAMQKFLRAARFCACLLFPNQLPVHLLFLPVRVWHFDPISWVKNPLEKVQLSSDLSLVRNQAPPAGWSWGAGATLGLGYIGLRVPIVGCGSPRARAGLTAAGDEGSGGAVSAWDLGRLARSN